MTRATREMVRGRPHLLPTAAAALLAAAALGPADAQAPPTLADTVSWKATTAALRSSPAALGVGDVVRLTVWRKPELSGEFVVLTDGSLAHPLYRGLRLAGLPRGMAEDQMRSFLSQLEKNPQFVLEPLVRVAVSGEVARPDVYSLRPETSVVMAVALAGGPTERGRRDRVRLLRDNRELLINLTHPDRTLARTTVRSGDEIIIERRRAMFREYVAPAITVAGATAAIVNVVLRYRGR
ncbi:MAG: SLBB domain-containing protein [Gemmatimonadota bacterium]|nr:SLBB domain-containing protein [Gemmatimonadota bacterium]